jgi:hypothetical protein
VGRTARKADGIQAYGKSEMRLRCLENENVCWMISNSYIRGVVCE